MNYGLIIFLTIFFFLVYKIGIIIGRNQVIINIKGKEKEVLEKAAMLVERSKKIREETLKIRESINEMNKDILNNLKK